MNKQLWLILIIAFLNAIGLTIVLPLSPFLVGQFVAAEEVALYLGMIISVYAFCQFLMAPVMGSLSDYFGRKPILFFSLLATGLGYLILGVGGALWVLFLGRIISGISAGDISALYAYVADSTEGKDRTKLYGYLGAANGIGFMVGPVIGGILGTEYLSLPFFVAGGISFVTAIFTYVTLPETLVEEKRKKNFALQAFNPFSHFKDIFGLMEARRLFILGGYFFIGLLFYQFNISVFLKDRFFWGPSEIGVLFALVGLCDIFSRAVLLPRLLGLSEKRIISSGLMLMIAGFGSLVLCGYLGVSGMLWVAVCLITVGEGLFDPTYNNILSQCVNESKQGQLQGVNQGLHSAYQIVVPLVAGGIYLYNPLGIYVLSTILMLMTLGYFLRNVGVVGAGDRAIAEEG